MGNNVIESNEWIIRFDRMLSIQMGKQGRPGKITKSGRLGRPVKDIPFFIAGISMSNLIGSGKLHYTGDQIQCKLSPDDYDYYREAPPLPLPKFSDEELCAHFQRCIENLRRDVIEYAGM